MSKKRLPVHLNPGLETECYHNFRLSLLMSGPERLAWCCNHFVNLKIQSKAKMHFPFVAFEEHLDIYSGLLTERLMDARGKAWDAAIREAIDQGRYVLIYLNWKRIEASNFYNGPDLVHDAIIYGYDREAGLFDLLAFEVNGKSYDAVQISFAACELELAHVLEEHWHANKWFAYYGFPISTIDLLPYADAEGDWRCLYFSLERGKVRPQGQGDDVFANGYFVNEYMASYFSQRALDGNIDPREYGVWNIVIVKMLQHKKWMLRRLAYLRQTREGSGSRLLQKSESLYEKAKGLIMNARVESYKYQKTGERRYLDRLAALFQSVFEQEKRAVPLLMEHLIDVRLHVSQPVPRPN